MTYRRLCKKRRPMPDAEYNQRLEAFRLPVPHDPRWWKMYGCVSLEDFENRMARRSLVLDVMDGSPVVSRYFSKYRGDAPPLAPSLSEFRKSGKAGEFLLAGD